MRRINSSINTCARTIQLPLLRSSLNKSKVNVLDKQVQENQFFESKLVISQANLSRDGEYNQQFNVSINLEAEMEDRVTSREVKIGRLEKLIKFEKLQMMKLLGKVEQIEKRGKQVDKYVEKLFKNDKDIRCSAKLE